MSQEDVDEFLAHFGVAGMRWGVRRARTKVGKRVVKINALIDTKEQHPDLISAKSLTKKLNKAGKLSDKTLDRSAHNNPFKILSPRFHLSNTKYQAYLKDKIERDRKVQEFLEFYKNVKLEDVVA